MEEGDVYYIALWGVRSCVRDDCYGGRRCVILPLIPNKHHRSLRLPI